jgi:hypothetical protein
MLRIDTAVTEPLKHLPSRPVKQPVASNARTEMIFPSPHSQMDAMERIY